MRLGILAALAAAVLTACGGGGGGSGGGSGGGGVSQPLGNTGPIIGATGGTPTGISSSEIKARLRSRAAAADSLLLTDFFDPDPLLTAVCSGAVCDVDGMAVDISDYTFDTTTYDSILTKNGVHFAQGSGSGMVNGTLVRHQGFVGWTDYGFFGITAQGSEDLGIVYGIAIGDATGSIPISGSATWTGLMVGLEMAREEAHLGDATLTADFAASNIDVVFANVRDVETGAARSGFAFDNVPMTGGGFSSRAGGRIEGAFYGPGHAEVGGIFEYRNTIGAFGAKRR